MAHRALASAWRVAEACSSPRRYPGSRRSPSLARARLPARCCSASRATAETLPSASGWVEANADAASLREHYEREGWVVVRGVADAALVDALHAATDALEEEAKTFTRSRRHRGVFFETQSASGRKSDDAIRAGALRKIGSPSKRGGAFQALVHSERIRDIALKVCLSSDMEELTLRCAVDQVNTKAPFSEGSGFAWHQDASFLKPLARASFDARGGVNVVVAMDGSDSDNGGIRSAWSDAPRRRGAQVFTRRVRRRGGIGLGVTRRRERRRKKTPLRRVVSRLPRVATRRRGFFPPHARARERAQRERAEAQDRHALVRRAQRGVAATRVTKGVPKVVPRVVPKTPKKSPHHLKTTGEATSSASGSIIVSRAR